MNVTISNAKLIRALADNPEFTSAELYKSEDNGHKFTVGETCILHGLENFPEFNGQQIKITAIREDGPCGKAYYIEGDINKFINWTYEYRLKEYKGVSYVAKETKA